MTLVTSISFRGYASLYGTRRAWLQQLARLQDTKSSSAMLQNPTNTLGHVVLNGYMEPHAYFLFRVKVQTQSHAFKFLYSFNFLHFAFLQRNIKESRWL